jgi:hypothetical protein
MKALREKILQECKMSKTLKENAWEEKDFDKCMEIRMKQQEHWEKFNFMKELNRAIQRKGR